MHEMSPHPVQLPPEAVPPIPLSLPVSVSFSGQPARSVIGSLEPCSPPFHLKRRFCGLFSAHAVHSSPLSPPREAVLSAQRTELRFMTPPFKRAIFFFSFFPFLMSGLFESLDLNSLAADPLHRNRCRSSTESARGPHPVCRPRRRITVVPFSAFGGCGAIP